MHEWSVVLTQTGGAHEATDRNACVIVSALDADDAARRAQRTYPGWTAVFVVRRP